ncbi:MAG: hypothetical protein WCF80_00675 [Pseudolabrys sp.]
MTHSTMGVGCPDQNVPSRMRVVAGAFVFLIFSHAFDVTVYIVLNYYGSRLGRAYAETGDDEADEKTTIENILSGQYSHPIRVVAFNTAEGWARDVTEDIAQAVLSKAQHEHRSISIAAQEFLVRTLGVDAPLSD